MADLRERNIERLMNEKLTGVISEADDHYLTALLESDAQLRQRWQHFQEVATPFLSEMDEEQAWDKVQHNLTLRTTQRQRKWWGAVAAAVVLIAGLAGMYLIFQPIEGGHQTALAPVDTTVKLLLDNGEAIKLSSWSVNDSIQAGNVMLKTGQGNLSYTANGIANKGALNTLVVPLAVTYHVTLSDGTKVWLNADSRLRFPFVFDGDKREVFLEGEAYFDVAANASQPFIVHTPLTVVNVLGTAFNVNSYDALNVKTSLVSGAVNITSDKKGQIQLQPGYEAVFTTAAGFTVGAFDQQMVLSWMKGRYYFNDTPLKDIVTVIKRWFATEVVFDQPAVASIRFTGAIEKAHTLDEFLQNLQATSALQYRYDAGVLHLTMK